MKITPFIIAALLGISPLCAEDAPKANNEQQIDITKVSEAFGNFIGKTLTNPALGIKFDTNAVLKGIKDGIEGKPSPMSEKEYEEAISILQERGMEQLSQENLQKANAFMKDNAKVNNIVEIEPGKLQYLIIQQGKGPKVEEHASPLIQYTGKFIDGTVFSSSDETGPIRISLDRTIPGFSKGLLGMHEGEKRRLFIHPDLAYGTKGDLSPNALLIFEVEILKSNDVPEAKPEQKP